MERTARNTDATSWSTAMVPFLLQAVEHRQVYLRSIQMFSQRMPFEQLTAPANIEGEFSVKINVNGVELGR